MFAFETGVSSQDADAKSRRSSRFRPSVERGKVDVVVPASNALPTSRLGVPKRRF